MSEYQPPSQEWLENEAERVCKLLKPKEYAREKRAGNLPEYRRLSVENCRDYVAALLSQGFDPSLAWRRAIHETLDQAEWTD